MRRPTELPHRLRDVPDVEAYVSYAVGALCPDPAATGALRAEGVQAVRRLERALPPEAPLKPVLDDVLPTHLESLHRHLRRRADLPAAA